MYASVYHCSLTYGLPHAEVAGHYCVVMAVALIRLDTVIESRLVTDSHSNELLVSFFRN